MPEETEQLRYRRMIDNLARTIDVNKEKKWDAACMRDDKTGAVVCASKKYISDSTHKVSGYVKIGGSRVIAVGDVEDIKKLEETIGP